VISAAAPAPVRTAGRRALLAGAIGAGGIAYLAASAFGAAATYYLTVDELLGQGEQAYGRRVRISGRVAEGTLAHDAPSGLLAFRVVDGGGSLPVVYRGVKPDMLGDRGGRAYQDVVVEGRLERDGVLHASALIVKHGAEFAARGAGP
jgi:cytochrome c-type biogenesis protein CcmE